MSFSFESLKNNQSINEIRSINSQPWEKTQLNSGHFERQANPLFIFLHCQTVFCLYKKKGNAFFGFQPMLISIIFVYKCIQISVSIIAHCILYTFNITMLFSLMYMSVQTVESSGKLSSCQMLVSFVNVAVACAVLARILEF